MVFTCTLVALACTCCNSKNNNSTDSPSFRKGSGEGPSPVQVRASLFHNPDSLCYYAALAYKDDDAYGLYVTGAAAFLREFNPDFPDSCTTVPLDEARIMLLHARDLGSADAQNLINCLRNEGVWEE